jgi:hypothetical protein
MQERLDTAYIDGLEGAILPFFTWQGTLGRSIIEPDGFSRQNAVDK